MTSLAFCSCSASSAGPLAGSPNHSRFHDAMSSVAASPLAGTGEGGGPSPASPAASEAPAASPGGGAFGGSSARLTQAAAPRSARSATRRSARSAQRGEEDGVELVSGGRRGSVDLALVVLESAQRLVQLVRATELGDLAPTQ